MDARLYRDLYRIRRVEEEVARAYPSDKIKSPVHLSIGQEAASVGVSAALQPGDIVYGTYRGHALYLARGGSTVSPEHLMSYELGLKVQAFDSRLRINAALFDNQWTDEQLFLSLNTPGTGLNPVYVNVPRTESHGVEVELEWIPARTWFVQTAIGVLHSSVKTISQPLAASNGALVGSTLIAAPQLTWNALVRKEWTLGPGRVSVAGDWSYTSSQHYDLVNSPDQLEPAYWLVNARAAYSFGAKHPYEVAFWAKNLTATQYCVQRSSLGGIPNGNTAVCVPNQARKFVGLTLSGSF